MNGMNGLRRGMAALALVGTMSVVACPALADAVKVGYSRVDITPPVGVFMTGYYKARHVQEVLDPLQVVCVAFADGRETALLLQVDTCVLIASVANRMRDEISAKTGVRRDGILVHASHTHDGGTLLLEGNSASLGIGGSELDLLYTRMVIAHAVDAAVYAIRDLKPAQMSIGRSEAKRISFGRRYVMKDGGVRTNPGVGNPDIVRPAGDPPDEEVQVLRIDRKGGKPIAVINFQTHPDVVGGETVTSDWPGLTRTVFEAATFGDSRVIVINGTQGDLNHVNVSPRPGEGNGLHHDFDDVDRGYAHAKHMANVIAAAALSVWMKCEPVEGGDVRIGTSMVRVPSHRAKDSDEKNLEWANKVWQAHTDGKDAELPWTGMALTTELARAARIRHLANGPDHFDLPLFAFAIGRSVAFGGFPGEPFNGVGKIVKRKSPFRMTILSCITNGSRGYFPLADSFKEDAYEAAGTVFGPSVAEDLVAGQLELLTRLHN